MRSGSATPIDWWADSSVAERRVPGAGQRQRAVVVDLREPEAAVLLGHLHARARRCCLRPSIDLVGDLRVALDLAAGRPRRRGTSRSVARKRSPFSVGLGVEPRLRVDQVEPEVAEEQLLAEARQLPLLLARGLGDLPCLLLADLGRHVVQPPGFNWSQVHLGTRLGRTLRRVASMRRGARDPGHPRGGRRVAAARARRRPAYDPWAWLLWGREVASRDAEHRRGPAFKPLPVAVCALLAPLGARRAGRVGAARARGRRRRGCGSPTGSRGEPRGARRGGGRSPARGVALAGGSRWHATTGGEAPLVLALALGAVACWRAGRLRAALALRRGVRAAAGGGVAVPGRSRAWSPGGGDPRLRPLLGGAARCACPRRGSCPEWLGSGDALRSGARARVPNPGQPALADVPALAVAARGGRAAALAAVVGVACCSRCARARARALAPAGAAWIALVAVMAQAGFSGEPRYALPGRRAARGRRRRGARSRSRAATRRSPSRCCAARRVAAVPAARRRCRDVRAPRRYQWALGARPRRRGRARPAAATRVLACGRPVRRPPARAAARLRARRDQAHGRPDAAPRAPGVVFRRAAAPPPPRRARGRGRRSAEAARRRLGGAAQLRAN